MKDVLEQWAADRKDEAVTLKKEVSELKKKKHLMLAMMNNPNPMMNNPNPVEQMSPQSLIDSHKMRNKKHKTSYNYKNTATAQPIHIDMRDS